MLNENLLCSANLRYDETLRLGDCGRYGNYNSDYD